ncbi:hypothetical protein [Curtobacterium sp. MCBD17_040]|uniref:hypothetical protein n=1 Tax=Curtobacterium sp. MCBD17_040 TaxID=2175674 RepID=UPI000DAA2E5D|nr:hypothetical protein [Curtobacterium sp. MCBD17_040]WIB65711.1 hypothetical protein DEI94_16450 [Curtobacterium sp. MCBD17_040]
MGKIIRVGGSGPHRTRFAEHDRSAASVHLKPPLGHFVIGSPDRLPLHSIRAIRDVNTSFENLGLPDISIDDSDGCIDLLYGMSDSVFRGNDVFVRVTLNDAGKVVDCGHGEDWFFTSFEDPRLQALMDEHGAEESELIPRPAV